MEMRWLVRGTERVLQYRKYVNLAVYAGMPDVDFVNRTANMQWSTWIDVPEYKEEL